MTEEQALQASVSTAAAALVMLAVAAAWTWGLRRLGARWAPRGVAIAALVLLVVVELMVWLGPRPDVAPFVMLWAGLSMPLLVVATMTLVLLFALTFVIALVGLFRQIRRAPS